MTRRPFNPNEADLPGDLDPTVADLDRYLADSVADPAPGFADHVMGEVAAQPVPRRGLWAVLAGPWTGDRGRMTLLAATVAAAVLAVVLAGQLPRLLPSNIGSSSPLPSVPPTMEPSPSVTVSPQPTEPATQSEKPSASPTEDEDTPRPVGRRGPYAAGFGITVGQRRPLRSGRRWRKMEEATRVRAAAAAAPAR